MPSSGPVVLATGSGAGRVNVWLMDGSEPTDPGVLWAVIDGLSLEHSFLSGNGVGVHRRFGPQR